MRGFIGIDIETTGLDPETGHILEVGVVLFDHELKEQASTRLLCVDPVGVSLCATRDLDPYVLDMHIKSGLLDEINEAEWDFQEAAESYAATVNIVASWHKMLGGKQPMLGSSVHFDREFLKVHMPEIEALFSHRNIDASSMREYAKVVDPDKYADLEGTFTQRATHRAVDDVMASAELVKVLAAESWVARTAATTS